MGAQERRTDRGARRGLDQIRVIGRELRDQRIGLGLSQRVVAEAAGVSRPHYSDLENGRVRRLDVVELNRVASVLGLDAIVRLYPGGQPLRDGAHARRLGAFLAHVRPPLQARTEVPLPGAEGRMERRAWDAVIRGPAARSAVELEMRLHDAQAQERRVALKRRDDPPDHFLLLVADTATNRRVLGEWPELFADLPRLRPGAVAGALEAGQHAGTGLVLV